jgi:hypothetical protein
MKRNLLILIQVSIIAFLPVITVKLEAIPAFARKYQISCQVCHSPIPHLKPFGEEFAANGYRLTEYESPRYFVPTGDDKLSLLREVPLAVRLDGIATYNFGHSKTVDFGALSAVKLISGGELSDKLSYYFYFFMSEGGDIVGVEDAFLTYSDLFGSGLNITFGQFQVCDPFYKRELRMTLEDIAILKAVPGQSTASLTYDRGMMLDYTIKGVKTNLLVEIVNGNGLSSGGEELFFDKDAYKNVLAKVSQPIGKIANIGLMGYFGKERMFANSAYYYSDIRMFGPILNLNFDQHLMINMQYVRRMDSDVYDVENDVYFSDITTQGGYLEAIYAPKGDMSKLYFTGLLNWVDSNYSTPDYKSATVNISYLLRRNVRLTSEYTYLSGEEQYSKVSLGFVAGF